MHTVAITSAAAAQVIQDGRRRRNVVTLSHHHPMGCCTTGRRRTEPSPAPLRDMERGYHQYGFSVIICNIFTTTTTEAAEHPGFRHDVGM
jgi:hypothetical protein